MAQVTITAKLLDHPVLGSAESQDIHLEALAGRWSVSKSEVIRALVQTGLVANPVDNDELAAAQAKRSGGRKRLTVGPSGKLVMMAERPDIQATYDLARAVSEGRASLAADGPRYKKHGADEEEERRERDSNPLSHPVQPTRLSGSTRALRPSSRPAVRPDRTLRRTLRAV